MKRINRKLGTTFIFSTHDKRVIARADRMIRVEDGEIARLGKRFRSRWSLVPNQLRVPRVSSNYRPGQPGEAPLVLAKGRNENQA